MSHPNSPPVRLVGLAPWLPWPLSAWRWWTQPVAAERLAALRIGLALFLLADIWTTYWPNLDAYFLEGEAGGSAVHGWYSQAPRWTWSVLRGLGDPFLSTLILFVWLGSCLRILFEWLTAGARPSVGWRCAWLLAGAALTGGNWLRLWDKPAETPSFWIVPCGLSAVALLVVTVDAIRHWLGTGSRGVVLVAGIALAACVALLAGGVWIDVHDLDIPILRRLLGPWQSDPILLRMAAVCWLVATALLLAGWQTRFAAIIAWVLSASFANANPNIDNAGDVIRGIILFYLMIAPCGAVWSIDRCLRREPEASGVVVHPWALRLLFIQLVLIYFVNGVYKVSGRDWLSGDSLHYVLSDVTLTRFSYAQMPWPLWLTRLATWSVLIWEVGFPLFVSLPWTRKPALWFGVLFHAGIYVTMELGNFVPYVLTMYLPLLPWETLRNRWPFGARGGTVETAARYGER
ncbi:MAG: HTTM domain-containing protein [Gemmataceae bacterium]|nr:HTTM domain-containing protein [Gemmataceae bacterium]